MGKYMISLRNQFAEKGHLSSATSSPASSCAGSQGQLPEVLPQIDSSRPTTPTSSTASSEVLLPSDSFRTTSSLASGQNASSASTRSAPSRWTPLGFDDGVFVAAVSAWAGLPHRHRGSTLLCGK